MSMSAENVWLHLDKLYDYAASWLPSSASSPRGGRFHGSGAAAVGNPLTKIMEASITLNTPPKVRSKEAPDNR